MRERDLFRAIVLSGAALAATPGCSSDPVPTDAPVAPDDAPVAMDDAPAADDTGTLIADTGADAGAMDDAGETDAGEDAMVLII